jgi:hypothetical protein
MGEGGLHDRHQPSPQDIVAAGCIAPITHRSSIVVGNVAARVHRLILCTRDLRVGGLPVEFKQQIARHHRRGREHQPKCDQTGSHRGQTIQSK